MTHSVTGFLMMLEHTNLPVIGYMANSTSEHCIQTVLKVVVTSVVLVY